VNHVNNDTITDAVDKVTDAVLDALGRDEAPTSTALRFLLREYAATGRDDIRAAIEPSLARALELAPGAPMAERPGWLLLFAEAAEASADDRLPAIAALLVEDLRSSWGPHQRFDVVVVGIEACLRATGLIQPAEAARDLIQVTIDELERIVGATYEPGQGVSGELPDQIAAASALLTAYQRTSRLPYSMLAEELVQSARRLSWTSASFELNCEAAVVLYRLAALHRADEYRETAVVAPDADYEGDAARILESLAADAPGRGLAGAAYGLAAAERQSAL
jgi:hypothetical protein